MGELFALLVTISNSVRDVDEEKLLQVFRDNKTTIGWSIIDIKGINHSLCMHKILKEENFRPSIDGQWRLYPNMKEMVRTVVSKLLGVGIFAQYETVYGLVQFRLY